jgi:hypothetical protein
MEKPSKPKPSLDSLIADKKIITGKEVIQR